MLIEAALDSVRKHGLTMPPVAAMQVQVHGYADQRLTLQAPLAANVNDKGSAFGGSLASLMTVAGWGLVHLRLALEDLSADIYVADSQVRYLLPLHTDLRAVARLADEAAWAVFIDTLRRRGRARIEILAQVPSTDGTRLASTLGGRFVALMTR